ncbi:MULTISPECIES: hypothetical protein [Streptomyces]|uniref:Uncharacterized protein n=1 Tax=Streptomyces lonegramiae TaxID=3075524 RepID=A0ABU2X8R8_9ACTN|nr:hypothetical protein [Streptomyces sp. DSM 41529]MDT0542303.1 hypothetical protein [Streptomyces sp. DSM 41529]
MTRSSSTATKRRGVALAAAVGVLTLGAMTSASAAGPSHTGSKGSSVVLSAAKGPKPCVVTPGKPVPAGKAVELGKAVQSAEATEATEVAKANKAVKAVKGIKIADLSVVKDVTGKPIRAPKCPAPAFPGKPGKPGTWCKAVEHQRADLALKGIPAKKCHVTPVPATPKKR